MRDEQIQSGATDAPERASVVDEDRAQDSRGFRSISSYAEAASASGKRWVISASVSSFPVARSSAASERARDLGQRGSRGGERPPSHRRDERQPVVVELLAERELAARVEPGRDDGPSDAHAAHRLLERGVGAGELDCDVDADAVQPAQLQADVRRRRVEHEIGARASRRSARRSGIGSDSGDPADAPWRRASWTVRRPNAPRPKIATLSPSLSDASCTACRAIVVVWSSVAVSGASPSGSLNGSPAAASTAKTCCLRVRPRQVHELAATHVRARRSDLLDPARPTRSRSAAGYAAVSSPSTKSRSSGSNRLPPKRRRSPPELQLGALADAADERRRRARRRARPGVPRTRRGCRPSAR